MSAKRRNPPRRWARAVALRLGLAQPTYPPLTPERLEGARQVAREYGLDPDTQAVLNPLENYTLADWAAADAALQAEVAERLADPVYRREQFSDLMTEKVTWRTKLGLGDPALAEAWRDARRVQRVVRESLRACRIYPPGQPDQIARLLPIIPDPRAPDACPKLIFLIAPSPRIRQSRYNDAFLEDLHDRLPNLGPPELHAGQHAPGLFLVFPLEHTPPKPPKCTLADLGTPPAHHALPLPLGMTTRGPLWIDLVDAPHILIAGATGSGKSTLLHAQLHVLMNDELRMTSEEDPAAPTRLPD